MGGRKTLCSRRGSGTQRRQAAFTPRRLRVFASSRLRVRFPSSRRLPHAKPRRPRRVPGRGVIRLLPLRRGPAPKVHPVILSAHQGFEHVTSGPIMLPSRSGFQVCPQVLEEHLGILLVHPPPNARAQDPSANRYPVHRISFTLHETDGLGSRTSQISDLAPLRFDCKPERHRRVHYIWLVGLLAHVMSRRARESTVVMSSA